MQRIALITGSARGIGAATAEYLADHNYDVCINYRALFDPAPVLTTLNAVHGHLRDAKFFR